MGTTIGLDLGTSGVKALLLSEDGVVLGEAVAALKVSRPLPAWSEQSPDDWWIACCSAINAVRQAVSSKVWSSVKAIGLSGQMHGAVLLDKHGAIIRPAILWNDGRAQAACQLLEQRLPSISEIAGNPVMAGFTAPKLIWLEQNEPQCFQRVAKVLLPKDWLRWKMTGILATEPSDASGTLWLDVFRQQWSADALYACSLDLHHVPELVPSADARATLRADVAGDWGLPAGVVVAAGAADNAAGALGAGLRQPGQALISLGTSGVILAVDRDIHARPDRGLHVFCHAMPKQWCHLAVLLSASSALSWWSGIVNQPVKQLLSELELDLDRLLEAPDRPLFLPYLSGERTPHGDPSLRATFMGLSHRNLRADMTLAVLEGVAFAFRDGIDTLRGAGLSIPRLVAIGGGARSVTWLRILTTVLECKIVRPAGAELGPALGAALLGWQALGHQSVLAGFDQQNDSEHIVQPIELHGWQERLLAFRERLSAARPIA